MIWHHIFFYKKQYIGNPNSVPTYSWKLHFCCPVLSLLARRRASPLVTWAGSRSWGSGLLGESQEKAEQEFLGRPAGCGPSGSWVLTPCRSNSLDAHRQSRLRAPFQGGCVKGKAATPPRLNSDRSNSTRIPDQAAPSGGNCIFLKDCWACLHVFYSELQ